MERLTKRNAEGKAMPKTLDFQLLINKLCEYEEEEEKDKTTYRIIHPKQYKDGDIVLLKDEDNNTVPKEYLGKAVKLYRSIYEQKGFVTYNGCSIPKSMIAGKIIPETAEITIGDKVKILDRHRIFIGYTDWIKKYKTCDDDLIDYQFGKTLNESDVNNTFDVVNIGKHLHKENTTVCLIRNKNHCFMFNIKGLEVVIKDTIKINEKDIIKPPTPCKKLIK